MQMTQEQQKMNRQRQKEKEMHQQLIRDIFEFDLNPGAGTESTAEKNGTTTSLHILQEQHENLIADVEELIPDMHGKQASKIASATVTPALATCVEEEPEPTSDNHSASDVDSEPAGAAEGDKHSEPSDGAVEGDKVPAPPPASHKLSKELSTPPKKKDAKRQTKKRSCQKIGGSEEGAKNKRPRTKASKRNLPKQRGRTRSQQGAVRFWVRLLFCLRRA